MKKPQMIIFDYGQTLVKEKGFDGLAGSRAVMHYAVENKYNISPEQLQEEANAVNQELKRFNPASRAKNTVEIPNYMFTAYLYESMGIKLGLTPEEADRTFWDAASSGEPTEGISEFLDYLYKKGIRTAVISNISYAGSVVYDRINRLLPKNNFEFIIATSEYLFRKPHPRIFRLALEKASLSPEDAWYIGDNYECDVMGARNAGLFPIWYKAEMEFEQIGDDDVLQIGAWSELQKMLEL